MKPRALTVSDLMTTAIVTVRPDEHVREASADMRLGAFRHLPVVDARGRLVGIEVKKTASPTSGDFKGLRHLAGQTGGRFLRGILLYTGPTSVAFGPDLHALPVSALWQTAATRHGR